MAPEAAPEVAHEARSIRRLQVNGGQSKLSSVPKGEELSVAYYSY